MTIKVLYDSSKGETVELVDIAPTAPPPPPPAEPAITGFAATPGTIDPGQQSTLTWGVANTVSLTLNGTPIPLTPPQLVVPSATTTYTLVATGAAGTTPATASLEVTVNVPAPPPPPPPPPPVVEIPPVVTKVLDPAKMIAVAGWMDYPNRYERYQNLTVLRPDAAGRAKVRIFGMNQASGGGIRFWDGVEVVNVNGAWVRPNLPAQTGPMALSLIFETPAGVRTIAATASTDPLGRDLVFDVDCNNIAEGWYKATVTGCESDGWSVADYAVYVLKGATAQPHALCPSVTASYEFIHPVVAGQYLHQFAWVPATHDPNYAAFPLRDTPTVVGPLTRDKLVAVEVGPNRLADIHRPCISDEGIWSTFHTQHYMFSDFERNLPSQPVLDGRRGVATAAGFMHVEWGTAIVPSPPFNGPVDNLYFTDTWRFGKVLMGSYRGEDRGKIVTLCGYRHTMPSYRHAPDGKISTKNLELVGDWSAIPPERRGFRRLWGIAWDSRAFVSDLAAPTIPAEKDLHPHATWVDHSGATQSAGIRVFLPDMGGSRICKLQFSPTSHAAPPVVTEFVTGLAEVFDCIEVEKGSGIMAATVRKQNRVVFISMDDGAILAEFPTTAPEGIAYQDGMLYYGSLALKNIKKRSVTINGDVITLGPEVVAVNASSVWVINGNSNYVKFAMDDGRFYQRGMIGMVSWSNINEGLAVLFPPGENVSTPINWLAPATPWTKLRGPQVASPFKYEGSRGYQTCVGFGPGRMFAGTVQESLVQFSAALPTDADTPDVTAGYRDWMARGMHLTHGFHGWNYGSGVGWNTSSDIDAFIAAHGHVPT